MKVFAVLRLLVLFLRLTERDTGFRMRLVDVVPANRGLLALLEVGRFFFV
jgi:hypothetical protein